MIMISCLTYLVDSGLGLCVWCLKLNQQTCMHFLYNCGDIDFVYACCYNSQEYSRYAEGGGKESACPTPYYCVQTLFEQ